MSNKAKATDQNDMHGEATSSCSKVTQSICYISSSHTLIYTCIRVYIYIYIERVTQTICFDNEHGIREKIIKNPFIA